MSLSKVEIENFYNESKVEHEKLGKSLEFLKNYNEKNHNDSEISDVLTQMLEQTKEHCIDEELMMQKLEYPDLDLHTIRHMELFALADYYFSDVMEHEPDAYPKVVSLLTEWLSVHLNDSDHKLYKYIQQLL